jgi:hypothetical protein
MEGLDEPAPSRRTVAGVIVIGGAAAADILVVRPWHLRWGATGQESREPLPGDDLIADPDLTATRAIPIRAPADRVWPWIAQLRQGRGGFYSYDLLENLVGCDIHSADRIEPDWQDVSEGDQVRLAPKVDLAVVFLEQGRSLVLRGGIPMGEHRTPLRLHLGLRAPGWAGRCSAESGTGPKTPQLPLVSLTRT